MNKFCNGRYCTKENLLAEIIEMKNSGDIEEKYVVAMKNMATIEYEGREEDISSIIEKLNAVHGAGTFEGAYFYNEPNLQDVESILDDGKGGWYYEESTAYKQYINTRNLEELKDIAGGISDKELAERLGIGKAYLSLLKKGARSMTLDLVKKIKKEFPEIDVEKFLD